MTSTTVDIDGVQATRRLVDAGAVRIALHELGEGAPLVLLHGGGPGASALGNFRGNVALLSRHFRILAVDLPGYGGSDKPEYAEAYQGFAARAVIGAMDALGIDRFHVLGNSLGGGVAVHLAVMYPGRIAQLALIGAAGAAPSFIVPSPSEGTKHLTGFYAPPGPSPERMEAFMKVMLYDQSLVTPEMVDQRYREAIDPEVREGVARVYAALAGGASVVGEEIWKRVPEITQPALLIWGRDDRMLPLDGALYMLSRMHNARLHVFARCGHWAQLEHRDEFNRLVIDFFTNGPSALGSGRS